MTHHLAATALALLLSTGTAIGATPVRYTQVPDGSSLVFTFSQLGSATQGSFRDFKTTLMFDDQDLAASSLEVRVNIASIDTQDAERDEALATPDLFDAARHPVATFVATSLERGATGIEAPGRLTIRGVTRAVRLPLKITARGAGLELSGQTTLRRLEFGVGQGDWRSTDSVADEVKVTYRVVLERAR